MILSFDGRFNSFSIWIWPSLCGTRLHCQSQEVAWVFVWQTICRCLLFFRLFPGPWPWQYVSYVFYTSDVARLVEALGLGAHLYADDTQLYGHCSPANSFELASWVLRAIDSIHEWMSSNRLSLNTGKTQFIWLGTKYSLAKRETDRLFSLLLSLTELTSVRNLGFIIDQEFNMKDHITKLFVKYARFDTPLHHQPSELWSMPSSARVSISPTAFSMGQVPTSLTVSNRS